MERVGLKKASPAAITAGNHYHHRSSSLIIIIASSVLFCSVLFFYSFCSYLLLLCFSVPLFFPLHFLSPFLSYISVSCTFLHTIPLFLSSIFHSFVYCSFDNSCIYIFGLVFCHSDYLFCASSISLLFLCSYLHLYIY